MRDLVQHHQRECQRGQGCSDCEVFHCRLVTLRAEQGIAPNTDRVGVEIASVVVGVAQVIVGLLGLCVGS
jgi:hypothetical protein